jgi:hypothetical protein
MVTGAPFDFPRYYLHWLAVFQRLSHPNTTLAILLTASLMSYGQLVLFENYHGPGAVSTAVFWLELVAMACRAIHLWGWLDDHLRAVGLP